MCECACVKVSGSPYAKILLLRFYNCVAGFYFQSNTVATIVAKNSTSTAVTIIRCV